MSKMGEDDYNVSKVLIFRDLSGHSYLAGDRFLQKTIEFDSI